jgi:hypothetical protein
VIRHLSAGITVCALGLVVAPAAAQSNAASAKASAEQKQSRYQIGVMERVLEGAVEHGVTMTRDRLQAVLPAEMQFISENARVRGFRLEGYGLFFDVIVPSFEGTMPWALRTLDQNDLGLGSALKALKAHVDAAGDADLEQALRRVELQVSPMMLSSATAGRAGAVARNVTGAPAVVNDQPPVVDPILNDPNEAYRIEIKQALMDAMLDHSSSLGIADSEWLTVAARRNDDPPRLSPADTEAGTMVIRLRGSDLSAFLARQISRDEAVTRIDVRVF